MTEGSLLLHNICLMDLPKLYESPKSVHGREVQLNDGCLHQRLSILWQVQARDELVDYVCKKEMGVYSQIFTPVGDTAQLDRVGKQA